LKKKGITGDYVVFSFVSRRLQPLQHRKHSAFRYEGKTDPTRFSPEPMAHSEVIKRCCKVLDNFDQPLTLPALLWAGNPPENSWVSDSKHFSNTCMSNSLCFSDEITLLQKNYKTWYCMTPSPIDAAQSGGNKKWKAAPGSLFQRKIYRLDSGQ
jgi:hypothetical protein